MKVAGSLFVAVFVPVVGAARIITAVETLRPFWRRT